MQGPEALLESLGISLPDPVRPGRVALLSPATRTVVNGHFFWVSSQDELELFRAAPHLYTGPLLDPFTHEWFVPGADSPRRKVPEGILLFSSPQSASEFEAAGRAFDGHAH